MLTLDEYRRGVVLRLEGCANTMEVKTLLAEADLWLTLTRISAEGEAAFWQAINRDLELFVREATLTRAKTLTTLLRAVLGEPTSAAPIRRRARARRNVRSIRGRHA